MNAFLAAALALCFPARAEAPLETGFAQASRLSKPQCEVKDRTKYCFASRQKGFSTWTYGDCHDHRAYAELDVKSARRAGAEAEVKTRTEYCVATRPPGFSTWSYSDCSWSRAEVQAAVTARRYSGACAD